MTGVLGEGLVLCTPFVCWSGGVEGRDIARQRRKGCDLEDEGKDGRREMMDEQEGTTKFGIGGAVVFPLLFASPLTNRPPIGPAAFRTMKFLVTYV